MDQTHSYGIVKTADDNGGKAITITGMVEKPKPGTAPSNLMITGRYILQPEIFDLLERQGKGAGGEIQLTDAMLALMERQPFTGVRFEGKSYDCGSKAGFLSANIAFALDEPELAAEIRPLIAALLAN